MTHSLPTRRSSDLKSVEVRASFSLRQLIEIRRVGAPLRPKVKDRDHERCGEQHGDQTGRGSADATAQLVEKSHCAGQGDAESEPGQAHGPRSEEHTSELQSLMRISYAVFCL